MADEKDLENNEPEDKGGEQSTDKPDGNDGGNQKADEPEDKGSEHQKGDTVNRYKHEREMGKLQKRIEDLEAENSKLKGKEDSVAALTKRLDEMEAKAKTDKVTAELEAAGCHNVKAAMACLEDHDGDVSKLKEAAPYLFTSSDKSKSTGGNPKGKPSDDEDEELDRAFGLK